MLTDKENIAPSTIRTSAHAEAQRRYIQRLDARLKAERGSKCQEEDCGSTDRLEWAHVKPTALQGRGRGKAKRLLDIKKHPDAYELLCRVCHAARDGFAYNDHFISADDVQEEIPF